MPNFDGTGPIGLGPQDGRGLGYCSRCGKEFTRKDLLMCKDRKPRCHKCIELLSSEALNKAICIQHKAFNDMLGKGFDSESQRRFLFHMYSKGDPHYQWVPEVWEKHGEPQVEKVDGPWEPPYGCWICGATKEFEKHLKKQGEKEMNWLKEFVESEEIKKIAEKVDANFLDRIKNVHEMNEVMGSTMRWATIEEALDDFARRNNLDNLQKRALSRRFNLQKVGIALKELEEDGIDSEKAIEYMSKCKNKHKELTEEKGKKIIKEKSEQNKKLAPDISKETSNEESSMENVGQQMARVDNKKIKIRSFCRKMVKVGRYGFFEVDFDEANKLGDRHKLPNEEPFKTESFTDAFSTANEFVDAVKQGERIGVYNDSFGWDDIILLKDGRLVELCRNTGEHSVSIEKNLSKEEIIKRFENLYGPYLKNDVDPSDFPIFGI